VKSKGNLTLLEFPEPPPFCKGLREIADIYQDEQYIDEMSALVLVRYPDGEVGYFGVGEPLASSDAHGLCTWVAADLFLQSQMEE
jgi:hypothetical protein